jgi:hypothetical protein
MATSEDKGFIPESNGPGAPYLRTWRVKAGRAIDVDWSRTLVNNWHHAYDQSTQVRVSWSAVGTSAPGVRPSHTTFTDVDTYYLMDCDGPFPWSVRHDGVLMRPVLRLAGAVNNASYEVTFKVCLMWFNDPMDHNLAIASMEIPVSSTTEQWVVAPSTYLTLPTNLNYQGAIMRMPTLTKFKTSLVLPVLHNACVGGVPASVQGVMCRLDTWVKADDTAAEAYLSGLYLREYIGT